MSEPRWTTLLEPAHRMEAEIVKEALEAQGFPAQIFQDGFTHTYFGNLGGKIEICVPSNRLEEAQIWLAQYQEGQLVEATDEELAALDAEDAEADE